MKEVISTSQAPEAIGPYSQAVKVGRFLFTSGQVALHPETKQMMQGSLREEVEQIMSNLSAVASAAGSALEHAVKTTIYLADLNDYQEVNQLYGSYFKSDPPARSTVQVAKLPAGANVEIDMIIFIP